MNKVINIDIMDDHTMVLWGLKNVLQAVPHFVVRNTYTRGEDLLKGLQDSVPDILLLDIQIPDVSGEELAAIIKKSYPEIKIIAVSGFDTTYYVKTMIEKGAKGYILKNTNDNILIEAIETVYNGEEYIDPGIRKQLLKDLLIPAHTGTHKPKLTRREKEVLKLIMQEQTSKEIAGKLNLSLRTVENQRVNIMQKLDVKNTVGLVKRTIELRLLEE